MIAALRDIPVVSDFYRHVRALAQTATKPKVTSQGFLFNGNPEQMSCTYESEIFEFLKSHVHQFQTFVNIGANTGYWPILVRHFGFLGQIYAFEPDRYNFQILKRNIGANRIKKINFQRIAIGEHVGSIEIYGFGTGVSSIKGWAGGHSGRKQVVPMDTLNVLLNSDKTSKLFLIDVEGAELGVIKGASSLLEAGNCEFLVELAAFDHQPTGVTINPNFELAFDLMWSAGYKAAGWFPNYRSFEKSELNALMAKSLEPSIQMYHFFKVKNS